MTTDTQLIPLEKVTPADLFAGKTDKQLTQILAGILSEAKKLARDLDVDKKADRKEMASVAYKVARSKTTIDNAGKDFAADLKNQIKVIDGRRKHARDTLEALQAEIRGPLDRWEENEQARIDGLTDAIGEMRELAGRCLEQHLQFAVEELEVNRKLVEEVEPSTFAEFEERCTEVRLAALATIDTAIARKRQYDADQAELLKLRKEREEREAKEAKERAEREQKEREERIAREAAEKAEREAEEKLRKEREAKEEALRAAKEALERAERTKEEVEAVQRRQEEARREEEERRQRNTRHKGKCNREAADAIAAVANCSPATAKKIVTAIVEGRIPRVKLEY